MFRRARKSAPVSGFFGKLFGKRPDAQKRLDVRLLLEALEDRTVLSTYVVDNTGDSGAGSLRQAIINANAHANVNGLPDHILFNIPTSDSGYHSATGSWTIAPTSGITGLTDAVVIDATSQPGFSTHPVIEIDGTNAGALASGIGIASAGNTVEGFAINRFGRDGILF